MAKVIKEEVPNLVYMIGSWTAMLTLRPIVPPKEKVEIESIRKNMREKLERSGGMYETN